MRTKLLPALILPLSLLAAACSYTPPSNPQYGNQAWLSISAMTGIKDPAINGAAIARYFEKGRYAINIQLNVDAASKGKVYYVWVEKIGTTEREGLGELQSPTGDVRHVLAFNSEKDLREFASVLVTVQDEGKTAFPGDPVARGTLEIPKK